MAVPLSNIPIVWANSDIAFTGMGFTINASAFNANSRLLSFNVSTNTSFSLTPNNRLVFTSNSAQSIIGAEFGSLFFRTSSNSSPNSAEYLRITNNSIFINSAATTINSNNFIVNSNSRFEYPMIVDAPLSAGPNSYGNTNEILVSQGNALPPLWKPGGKLLQVQAARSGAARQTISSTVPVAVNGLSIAFTPLSSTSTIIIQVHLAVTKGYVMSFGIFKDGAKTVDTGLNNNNNESGMQATVYEGSDNDQIMSIPIFHFEPSVNRTTRTYQVYATAGWSGANALYINDRASSDMASFSHMIIFEVEQ